MVWILLAVAVVGLAVTEVAVNVDLMVSRPLPSSADYAWRFGWARAIGRLAVWTVTAELATAFGARVWRWREMPSERVGPLSSSLMASSALLAGGGGVTLTYWALSDKVRGPDTMILRGGLIGASLLGLLLVAVAGWTVSRPNLRPRPRSSFLAVILVISLLAVASLGEHLGQPGGSWTVLSSYWSIRPVPHLDDTPAYTAIDCSGLYCMALGAGVDPSLAPVASFDGGRTWKVVPTAVSDQMLAFTGATVSCWDPDHCLAAGASTVMTSDGGRTWSTVSPHPGFLAAGVVCPSARHCVLYGRSTTPGKAGFVPSTLFTDDGGRTWAPTVMPPGGWQPRHIVCPSTSTCYGTAAATSTTGVATSGPVAILESGDGGRVWTAVPLGAFTNTPMAISCPTTVNCVAMSFDAIRGSKLSAIGADRFQFGTAGEWASSRFVGSQYPATVSCADVMDCLAVSNDGSSAVVFASHDGGFSWYRSATLHGLAPGTLVLCTSRQVCLLAGGQGTGVVAGPHDRGQILLGNYIGVTWTDVHTSAG